MQHYHGPHSCHLGKVLLIVDSVGLCVNFHYESSFVAVDKVADIILNLVYLFALFLVVKEASLGNLHCLAFVSNIKFSYS